MPQVPGGGAALDPGLLSSVGLGPGEVPLPLSPLQFEEGLLQGVRWELDVVRNILAQVRPAPRWASAALAAWPGGNAPFLCGGLWGRGGRAPLLGTHVGRAPRVAAKPPPPARDLSARNDICLLCGTATWRRRPPAR